MEWWFFFRFVLAVAQLYRPEWGTALPVCDKLGVCLCSQVHGRIRYFLGAVTVLPKPKNDTGGGNTNHHIPNDCQFSPAKQNPNPNQQAGWALRYTRLHTTSLWLSVNEPLTRSTACSSGSMSCNSSCMTSFFLNFFFFTFDNVPMPRTMDVSCLFSSSLPVQSSFSMNESSSSQLLSS